MIKVMPIYCQVTPDESKKIGVLIKVNSANENSNFNVNCRVLKKYFYLMLLDTCEVITAIPKQERLEKRFHWIVQCELLLQVETLFIKCCKIKISIK